MPKLKTIETPADLKKELSKVFYAVKAGRLDPATGSRLGFLGQVFCQIFGAERAVGSPEGPSPIMLLTAELRADRLSAGIKDDAVGEGAKSDRRTATPLPGPSEADVEG